MRQKGKGSDPHRYLQERDGLYYYKRRVPGVVGILDERAPIIRISLKTDDLEIAMAKRNVFEAADNDLWASLITNTDIDGARLRYAAARSRAAALGFRFRSGWETASAGIGEVVDRVLASKDQPIETRAALLGGVPTPAVTVSQAFDIYCDKIMRSELATKSKVQKASWKKVKKRAITLFKTLVGDKDISEITREDAHKLYTHWLDRIAPENGRPSHTASIGNRDIGNLRILYRKYFAHIGEKDRKNPFEGLTFVEKKKRKRPPFPTDWIQKEIMKAGALAGMNDEQRGIVLAIVETGARPSEICNLAPEAIVLEHPVPHLKIEPRDDPEDPREIKTESSIRNVPLVGVALEVFKKHPNGFPRYREKEASLSAAANKYFRENDLLPTSKHKLYSLRHSFEDRMKNARLDSELRKILMGHTIDRPDYGEGGSMELRRDELKKIALPFDPSIV